MKLLPCSSSFNILFSFHLKANNNPHLNDVVHYVVPGKMKKKKETKSDAEKGNDNSRQDNDDTENETNDLKVYVSTPNGLKRVVERTNSQASSNSKYVQKIILAT